MDARVVTVGLVAPRLSQTLDIVGLADAFAQGGQGAGARVSYAVTLLGTKFGPITAASRVR